VKYFSGYRFAGRVAIVIVSFLVFSQIKLADADQDSKPAETPSGNAESGKRIFAKNGCYECHGREGQGSNMTGPRIAPDPVPFDVLTRYVRKPTGEMPPYTAKVISDQDLADIYAFLQSRPHPPAAKNNPLLK
jgi:mono/diheme cytochrome c family protein